MGGSIVPELVFPSADQARWRVEMRAVPGPRRPSLNGRAFVGCCGAQEGDPRAQVCALWPRGEAPAPRALLCRGLCAPGNATHPASAHRRGGLPGRGRACFAQWGTSRAEKMSGLIIHYNQVQDLLIVTF